MRPAPFFASVFAPDEAYLRDKSAALAAFTIRMCLVAGGTGFLLWAWDWTIDPASAWGTLPLRIAILATAFLYPAALRYSRNLRLQALSAFGMILAWLGAFFRILALVEGGMVYGIGGFMLFQVMGILVLQGRSFRLNLLYDILIVALPHLLGSLDPALGFPHLAYAVLIWPTALMTATAQYALDQGFRRQRELKQALEDAAFSDALTGAWNRRHFEQLVPAEVAKSMRHRLPLSVLMMDIDHFKRVNDAFGHPVGDEVLREVANVMRKQSRVSDVLIRWGGEEFLLLLPATPEGGALEVAEKIRMACGRTDIPPAGRVTLSLGVAEHRGEPVEAWLQRADGALYAAKAGGRNRTVVAPVPEGATPETPSLFPLIRLPWRESYTLGHPVLDAQHRDLVDLANALLDQAASASTPAALAQALEALFRRIQDHFSEEEQVLADAGYPHLAGHRLAHEALLQTATWMKRAFREDHLDFNILMDFLVNRLLKEHMLKEDRAFRPWLG